MVLGGGRRSDFLEEVVSREQSVQQREGIRFGDDLVRVLNSVILDIWRIRRESLVFGNDERFILGDDSQGDSEVRVLVIFSRAYLGSILVLVLQFLLVRG